MNLIYAHSFAAARSFAEHNDLMPGDWKWIQDADVVRQHARADIYKVADWQHHPLRDRIDEAIERARESHRLGIVTDADSGGGTLGVSGA